MLNAFFGLTKERGVVNKEKFLDFMNINYGHGLLTRITDYGRKERIAGIKNAGHSILL